MASIFSGEQIYWINWYLGMRVRFVGSYKKCSIEYVYGLAAIATGKCEIIVDRL